MTMNASYNVINFDYSVSFYTTRCVFLPIVIPDILYSLGSESIDFSPVRVRDRFVILQESRYLGI